MGIRLSYDGGTIGLSFVSDDNTCNAGEVDRGRRLASRYIVVEVVVVVVVVVIFFDNLCMSKDFQYLIILYIYSYWITQIRR